MIVVTIPDSNVIGEAVSMAFVARTKSPRRKSRVGFASFTPPVPPRTVETHRARVMALTPPNRWGREIQSDHTISSIVTSRPLVVCACPPLLLLLKALGCEL